MHNTEGVGHLPRVVSMADTQENSSAAHKKAGILFLLEEEGQGLAEYGLVIILVAILIIAILLILGPQAGNLFSRITNGLAKG